MRWLVYIAVGLLLGSLWLATAQPDTCPAFVEEAFAHTDEACMLTGRNQACYGHVLLQAEARDDAPTDFQFEHIGDIAPVTHIQALRLSAFDATSRLWGIALLRLQANLPDTLPGQNVTFLLFGDVTLTDAVDAPPVTLDVTPTMSTRVYRQPLDSAAVLDTLDAGQTITADGRSDDGLWLRVHMPVGAHSVGWIPVNRLMFAGDAGALEVLEASDTTPRFRPMQAFYLTTGIKPHACREMPAGGALVQTPREAGKVTLLVNNVEVRVGSTVLFQAQPGGDLTVTTLEGSATVNVDGQIQEAVAGTRVRVALDENLQPVGPPSPPEPYTLAETRALELPVARLDEPVAIHPPLTEREVEALRPPEILPPVVPDVPPVVPDVPVVPPVVPVVPVVPDVPPVVPDVPVVPPVVPDVPPVVPDEPPAPPDVPPTNPSNPNPPGLEDNPGLPIVPPGHAKRTPTPP